MKLAIAALLLFPLAAFAQDMPLFTIVKDGENWKPGLRKKPSAPSPKECTTPDGSVRYSAVKIDGFVHAYQISGESSVLPLGGPYAALRIEAGYDNDKRAQEIRKTNAPKLAVTALAVDSDGRIYAGTKLGIQIFDPSGRLCGVLALPAPGEPEHLMFEGAGKNELAVWVNDKNYLRVMKATGQ